MRGMSPRVLPLLAFISGPVFALGVAPAHLQPGPTLSLPWTEHGRLRRRYVRAIDAERVNAGVAEWKRLHPPARSARDLLANLRRLTLDLED